MTFGAALDAMLKDPDNLAISRDMYFQEGVVICEKLPSIRSEVLTLENLLSSPILISVFEGGEYIFNPSQEDIHCNGWFLLKKTPKPKDVKPEPLEEEDLPVNFRQDNKWLKAIDKLYDIVKMLDNKYSRLRDE